MIKYLEPLDPGARCRRWNLVAGRDKAHRRKRRFDGTKREALAALDAYAGEVGAAPIARRECPTLAGYSREWLRRLSVGGAVDIQTVDGYSHRLGALCAVLGDTRLCDIDARALDDAYAAMLGGKSRSGKPLSGTYVRDIHTCAHTMMEAAVADGLIAANPCGRATPPKRDTQPKRALEDIDMRLLVAMLEPDSAYTVAVLLAVTTGLRRGELCALRWEDVDLQNGVLEVARAARRDGSVKDTKTRAGCRRVPLPPPAAHALAEWKEVAPPSEWVIVNRRGEALHPNAIGHWWQRHRAAYMCDGVTLHELRHTYITSLARAGVHPEAMAELAGHASARVSLDVYSHLSMDEKRAAVASVWGEPGGNQGELCR